MDQLLGTIYEHRFTVGTVSWYIVSAAIISLPEKGQPFVFRDYIYDFSHMLLNLRPVPPAFRQVEQMTRTSTPTGIVRTETAKTIEQGAASSSPASSISATTSTGATP